MGRVDHHNPVFLGLRGQFDHDRGEHANPAPPLSAIVERLRRAIGRERMLPHQPIALNEGNAAQQAPFIDAWLAMALGKEGFQTRHLRVRQPEKVVHLSVALRSLNHSEGAISMGPDSKNTPQENALELNATQKINLIQSR